jgi:hypothetical protein
MDRNRVSDLPPSTVIMKELLSLCSRPGAPGRHTPVKEPATVLLFAQALSAKLWMAIQPVAVDRGRGLTEGAKVGTDVVDAATVNE